MLLQQPNCPREQRLHELSDDSPFSGRLGIKFGRENSLTLFPWGNKKLPVDGKLSILLQGLLFHMTQILSLSFHIGAGNCSSLSDTRVFRKDLHVALSLLCLPSLKDFKLHYECAVDRAWRRGKVGATARN